MGDFYVIRRTVWGERLEEIENPWVASGSGKVLVAWERHRQAELERKRLELELEKARQAVEALKRDVDVYRRRVEQTREELEKKIAGLEEAIVRWKAKVNKRKKSQAPVPVPVEERYESEYGRVYVTLPSGFPRDVDITRVVEYWQDKARQQGIRLVRVQARAQDPEWLVTIEKSYREPKIPFVRRKGDESGGRHEGYEGPPSGS